MQFMTPSTGGETRIDNHNLLGCPMHAGTIVVFRVYLLSLPFRRYVNGGNGMGLLPAVPTPHEKQVDLSTVLSV
jgi:hypothetical protein